MVKNILIIMITFSSAGLAQNQAPSLSQIQAALDDADYSFRRYEEITDQINFNNWQETYSLVEATRQSLGAARTAIRSTRPILSNLKASQAPSASELFQVYNLLVSIESSAGILGRDVANFEKNFSVATDLINLGTRIIQEGHPNLQAIFEKRLMGQERELGLCHSVQELPSL